MNFQVVIVGHPFAPIGRGEDVRCMFRAFKKAGFSVGIYDVYSFIQPPKEWKEEFGPYLVQELSEKFNIFLINGDEIKPVLEHIGKKFPSRAYNIISPQWELSHYPEEWAKELNHFNEVWAPSRFVQECLKKATSLPVFHMPYPVEVRVSTFLGRRYFGLPESAFIFLFFFDFKSYMERKNPKAILSAFERICELRSNRDIRLVLKVNEEKGHSGAREEFLRLLHQSRWKERIILLEKNLPEDEMKNLIRCCDCFISLHRSEGFGRGLAEAMYLGKPVIGTAYSGNMDYMTEENSCPVSYTLVKVKEGEYPHAEGQVWAEPDIDEAVSWMLKLIDDPQFGAEIGKKASRTIRVYFSYRAMGLRYLLRLKEISEEKKVILSYPPV